VTTLTSHWIFLGNFADLDTNETNDQVENRGDLIGTTFDTTNHPDMQILEGHSLRRLIPIGIITPTLCWLTDQR